MTTPTEAAARIVQIKEQIKALASEGEALERLITNAIDLGELDPFLMADDKGYALDNVRVCPVIRTTYTYFDDVKKKISQLQEQAKVEGHAIAKQSRSYRFTVIGDAE